MKRTLMCAILALDLFAQTRGYGQGTFQNLDFEAAILPVVPNGQFAGEVPGSAGIPGWTAYWQANGNIFHNTLSLGGAAIIIYGPQWDSAQILQGQYSLAMNTDFFGAGGGVAIGQTGQIPPGSKSLLFYATPLPVVRVSFAGQNLPFTEVSQRGNYNVFGADISAFAGMFGELRFTTGPSTPTYVGGVILDNIQFSTLIVPEPSTIAVLLGGLGIFAVWRQQTRCPR